MKIKKMIGSLLLIIGVVLVLFGFYGRSAMAGARGKIDSSTSLIPNNPAKSIVKGGLNRKVNAYERPVMLCFIAGGILIVIGGAILCCPYCRKKGR